MRVRTKQNQGFTLIETIIYVALFGIMIVGVFISIFQILYNTHSLERTSNVEEEINYIVRKIDYLMSDVTSLSSGDIDGSQISFEKADDLEVVISLQGDDIEVCIDGSCDSITSTKVKTESLVFTEIPASGNAPIGVNVDMTINGREVSIKKYLRI